jgi:hypothetical protein
MSDVTCSNPSTFVTLLISYSGANHASYPADDNPQVRLFSAHKIKNPLDGESDN